MPKPVEIHWADHLTDAALAMRLRMLAENIRQFTVKERNALLFEAAHRLEDPIL
jgi:hypothetical protein